MDGGDTLSDGATLVREGEFAGWMTWLDSDPFETLAGPYYFRHMPDGSTEAAFVIQQKNLNGHGVAHGGSLITFADFALFATSRRELAGSGGVTVSLNGEFIGPANLGDLVLCRGEVTRAGGSLIFARGTLLVKDTPVFTYSGVIKRLKRRSHG
jgi:uncharacterized protein (TIGR00369 family)